MKNKLRKFARVLANVISAIIIILAITIVYSVVKSKIQKLNYIDFFGYTIFEVSTGSMSGTIEIGDLIIVKIDNTDIQENDIVAFKQEEYIVTHRIIEIQEEQITTKGDANNTEDKPISKQDVIGKVIQIIPGVGIWKKVLLTPQIIISLIVTIILIVVAVSYIRRKGIDEE